MTRKGVYMTEGMKLFIWMVFVVWDLWIILDYEWHKKEVRYDKIRKSRAKIRKASRNRGRGSELTLLWNDMDRFHGNNR